MKFIAGLLFGVVMMGVGGWASGFRRPTPIDEQAPYRSSACVKAISAEIQKALKNELDSHLRTAQELNDLVRRNAITLAALGEPDEEKVRILCSTMFEGMTRAETRRCVADVQRRRVQYAGLARESLRQ